MKITLVAISALLLFVGGFLTAKHYYAQHTDTTQTTEVDHIITIIKEHKNKDGSTDTVTKIDKKTKETTNTVLAPRSKNNISALVTTNTTHFTQKPVYGVSFNREVLGPMTLGVYGLTDKTIGISIGVNF